MRMLSNNHPAKVRYSVLRLIQAVSNMNTARMPTPASIVAAVSRWPISAERNASSCQASRVSRPGPRKRALQSNSPLRSTVVRSSVKPEPRWRSAPLLWARSADPSARCPGHCQQFSAIASRDGRKSTSAFWGTVDKLRSNQKLLRERWVSSWSTRPARANWSCTLSSASELSAMLPSIACSGSASPGVSVSRWYWPTTKANRLSAMSATEISLPLRSASRCCRSLSTGAPPSLRPG